MSTRADNHTRGQATEQELSIQAEPGFPFAPLAAAAGNPGTGALAAQLGVTRRTVHRWRRAGVVPARRADLAAVRLGHHPAEIWPTEWSAA